MFLTEIVFLKEFNSCCWENVSLFYVFVKVSMSLVLSLQLLFIAPFFTFCSTSSLLCLLCITSPISPPVLWPLTTPPYHPPTEWKRCQLFCEQSVSWVHKRAHKALLFLSRKFLDEAITGEKIGVGPRCKEGRRKREWERKRGRVNIRGKGGRWSEALLISCIYFHWIKWSWGSD